LIGPEPSSPLDWRSIVSRSIAGLAVGSGAIALAVVLAKSPGSLRRLPAAHQELGTVEVFARELFTRALVPFEIMTVLFIVAVVGSIALVRRRRPSPRAAEPAKEDLP
jgi:NADH-quinone oxidoreductase subunit J